MPRPMCCSDGCSGGRKLCPSGGGPAQRRPRASWPHGGYGKSQSGRLLKIVRSKLILLMERLRPKKACGGMGVREFVTRL